MEGIALALEFKDLYDELQALCMVILDKWSKYPTNEQPYGHRNIIAHGGNIVADMRTIAFIAEQNADRTNRWKAGFLEYYGEEYHVCAARNLQLSHRKLLEIFNIAASIKTLYKWHTRTGKTEREVIESKCNNIIGGWKKGLEGLFEDNSSTIIDYHKAVELYYK